MTLPLWRHEFAEVLSCSRCTATTDRNLLRDDRENVPQPGFIGAAYDKSRVLLIGQNPGTPKTLEQQDLPYTAALRALRDQPTEARYAELCTVLNKFIALWPVHGSYFPLQECGLTLSDIAYFNVVRCRTTNDKSPGSQVTRSCIQSHLVRWLELLKPRVVVFIGRWASQQASAAVSRAGIPQAFMNRQRSLSTDARIKNRGEVAALVRRALS